MSGRFAWIIEALRGCVATRLSGLLPSGEVVTPLAPAFVVVVLDRFTGLARRFGRLVQQAADGTLPRVRARPAVAATAGTAASAAVVPDADGAGDATGVAAPDAPDAAAAADPPRRLTLRDLPRRFGWFIALRVPEAEAYAARLHDLLQQPEMIELASSHPSFGRVLRPLCHMLAIAPHPDLALLPPPPPPPPRVRRRRARSRAAGETRPWARPLPHCDGLPGRDGAMPPQHRGAR